MVRTSHPAHQNCVCLLGAFRIQRGEQSIHLAMHKVESLLAYLILHPETHAWAQEGSNLHARSERHVAFDSADLHRSFPVYRLQRTRFIACHTTTNNIYSGYRNTHSN